MGCSSYFSSAPSQTELERRIRERRKEYDLKLSKYIMSSINENIRILSKGDYKTDLKENPQEVILQKFVDGICEVQKRLQKKEYPGYKELGKLVDKYFTHGNDNNYIQICILRTQMTKWFDDNK